VSPEPGGDPRPVSCGDFSRRREPRLAPPGSRTRRATSRRPARPRGVGPRVSCLHVWGDEPGRHGGLPLIAVGRGAHSLVSVARSSRCAAPPALRTLAAGAPVSRNGYAIACPPRVPLPPRAGNSSGLITLPLSLIAGQPLLSRPRRRSRRRIRLVHAAAVRLNPTERGQVPRPCSSAAPPSHPDSAANRVCAD